MAKPHFRRTRDGRTMLLHDGLANVVAGIGTDSDKASHSTYVKRTLSHRELQLAYRGSWIARKLVNIPAQDATRQWRKWTGDPDLIKRINDLEKRLGIRRKTRAALIAGRLYGGSALLIGTRDNDLSAPLDPMTVTEETLSHITPLSRYDLTPNEIDLDITSEWFGYPETFDLQFEGEMVQRIHPSRFALFHGAQRAEPGTTVARDYWSDSVLNAPWQAVLAADATMANVGSLIFEAKVDTFGIPGLSESLQDNDPELERAVADRLSLMQKMKSIVNAMVHDSEEVVGEKTAQFTGLAEVMDRFLQVVSGAADIPITRFLGVSPGGLNSTGESDFRNYYDHVADTQTNEISPAMSILDRCLAAAITSDADAVQPEWRSLWQPTEIQRIEAGSKIVNIGSRLKEVLPPETVQEAVVSALIESGALPSLQRAVDEHGIEMEFEEDDDDPLDEAAGIKRPVPVKDAEPRTLYVSRKVLNADDIIAWAKAQGFETTLPAEDLHVTIAYSHRPVDWMETGQQWMDEIEVGEGGPRLVEKLGGEAHVILFRHNELIWRHQEILHAGASWDYPEYQPHITVSYQPPTKPLDDVEPYRGEIRLGPEIFEELDVEWKSKVTED